MQIITVAPNSERRVSELLSALAIEHWIFRSQWHQPVFPRYVFVQASGRWNEIRELSPVTDFLRADGAIYDLRDSEFANLRSRADANGVIQLPDPISRFHRGDAVMVTGMQSLIFGNRGTYSHGIDGDKAYVLLPWFNGQMVPTLVNANDIDLCALSQRGKKRRRPRRRGKWRVKDPARH